MTERDALLPHKTLDRSCVGLDLEKGKTPTDEYDQLLVTETTTTQVIIRKILVNSIPVSFSVIIRNHFLYIFNCVRLC